MAEPLPAGQRRRARANGCAGYLHPQSRRRPRRTLRHESWRSRPLAAFPYALLDACYEKDRHGGRIIDCAVLIALGIGPDGKRQILGASVALSEAEVHWRDFLTSLQKRGLCALQLFVSDDHAGLAAARRAVFPSVPWQRCQFHLQQNAQAYVPRLDLRAKVAADIRRVFLAPDRAHAQAKLQEIVAAYAATAPKLSSWMEENLPEGLMAASAATLLAVFQTVYLAPLDSLSSSCPPPTSAVCAPPTPSNASTLELKRRTRVAPIFPNEASLLRLTSAVLNEISDNWLSSKIYLDMNPSTPPSAYFTE